jgi:hypothetical protein
MNYPELACMLADKEAIRELRYRFGRALDTREWPAFGELFTDEIDADYSQFGVPPGRMPKAELVGMMQHAFRHEGMRTQQLYSNFLISLHGDSARCVSYLHGHHYLKDFPGGETFEIRAAYHDRMIRRPEGWKIEAVRLDVLSMVGNVAMVS